MPSQPMSKTTPQSYEEALALMKGRGLELFRKDQALYDRLRIEAQRYADLPPDEWPSLSFNWDLDPDSQRFALDGVDPAKFTEQFPSGLISGEVELSRFDTKLAHSCRRNGPEELWSLGVKSKLALAIAYAANGLPVTPPIVRPWEEREIIFVGGHHRYAVAKAIQLETLPIYARPEDRAQIDAIVPVQWHDT